MLIEEYRSQLEEMLIREASLHPDFAELLARQSADDLLRKEETPLFIEEKFRSLTKYMKPGQYDRVISALCVWIYSLMGDNWWRTLYRAISRGDPTPFTDTQMLGWNPPAMPAHVADLRAIRLNELPMPAMEWRAAPVVPRAKVVKAEKPHYDDTVTWGG